MQIAEVQGIRKKKQRKGEAGIFGVCIERCK
jgi:hypothetical protein